MPSNLKALSNLKARLSRAKRRDPGSEPTLTFSEAAAEIARALGIGSEAAAMTLYGLCATGNVQCLNDQSEVIDEDCTIAELHRSPPRAVIASDVLPFLTDWSPDPLPHKREGVIRQLLAAYNPPRNISWKQFCGLVRERCNGWIGVGRPAHGFGDKQIQRIVKDIRAR